jgi:hypothetical protein
MSVESKNWSFGVAHSPFAISDGAGISRNSDSELRESSGSYTPTTCPSGINSGKRRISGGTRVIIGAGTGRAKHGEIRVVPLNGPRQ